MAEHNEPCCVGTVKVGELQGVSKQIGALETYVVGPSTAGTPAVLLLPDVFGSVSPTTSCMLITWQGMASWLQCLTSSMAIHGRNTPTLATLCPGKLNTMLISR
ncbi:hypothetical protein WJX77_012701 [Trebouxia sp. C0004]